MVEVLPYVPIAAQLRIGISIFTYCDQVTFGITGDYDAAPDVEPMARAIEEGIAELASRYRPTKTRPTKTRATRTRTTANRRAVRP